MLKNLFPLLCVCTYSTYACKSMKNSLDSFPFFWYTDNFLISRQKRAILLIFLFKFLSRRNIYFDVGVKKNVKIFISISVQETDIDCIYLVSTEIKSLIILKVFANESVIETFEWKYLFCTHIHTHIRDYFPLIRKCTSIKGKSHIYI